MTRHAWLAATAIALMAPAPPGAEEGFVPLFDGASMRGWTEVGGRPGNWEVREGGILATRGEGGGWISTDREYDNFVLRLEYRLGPGGNSGVFLRAPRHGDPAYTGMEVQVLDDDHPMYKDLKPSQYAGSIYGVVAADRGHVKPAGSWNALEIATDGPKVVVRLNGSTVVDANLSDHADDAPSHPGILRPGGHLGLQSHTDPVEFRNIRIKPR